MLEEFETALKKTLNKENVLTENGAVGYKTSGSPLVDFNFKMSSYRSKELSEIMSDFADAFNYDPVNAVKLLFFAGDVRQGMGERRVFKAGLAWLAKFHKDYCDAVIPLIAEYGRWDYVVDMLGTGCDKKAWSVIQSQFDSDMEHLGKGEPVSLLAKWLPSVNASNKESNLLGKRIAKRMMIKERMYRKMLSNLRRRIDVVEKKMSAGNWSEINYNGVPSKANILYRNAFLKHDECRRKEYLDALTQNDGTAKINSSVAFPHDIVSSYENLGNIDPALEAMWKALPDYTNGQGGNVICMVDGSGSMGTCIGRTSVSAHAVARSLGIYFSERLGGAFKDKYITFSRNPKLVKLSKCNSLYEKIEECRRHDECENTDIEKAFDLILRSAIDNSLKQEQIPGTVLVMSDMEFDSSCYLRTPNSWYSDDVRFASGEKTLFEEMAEKYKRHGYRLPRLVFWNINSRSCAVPIQENELGVALVSGFSPSIASMVLSGKFTPEEVLMDKLNSERYEPVGKALAESGL